MKIFEVTGQQPQQMTKMKVIQATPNKVTLQDPQNPQTQTTFDPSKNPNSIQQGPQGVMVNPTADPNAPPTMPQLRPGSEVNVAGGIDAPSQPGSPLTPNPKPQDQAAAEEIGDDPQATTPIAGLSRRTDKAGNTQRKGVDPRAFAKFQQGLPREDYVPTGYNDKNREKAMMRKAMQQITQDNKFISETNDIVALARRVSNIQPKANTNQRQDVINLKKLAGL